MSCYQNVCLSICHITKISHYQNVLLPKTSVTKVSLTKTSGYHCLHVEPPQQRKTPPRNTAIRVSISERDHNTTATATSHARRSRSATGQPRPQIGHATSPSVNHATACDTHRVLIRLRSAPRAGYQRRCERNEAFDTTLTLSLRYVIVFTHIIITF